MSKLDFAIVVLLVAGCAFWIEQGQRVVIDAPTQSELAAAAAVVAACPDNDSLPYSANCILFMSGTNWRANAAESATTEPPPAEVGPPPASLPCPDRDNVPYSASCLAYLQGATTSGMRWRVSAPAMPAPLNAPTPVAAAIAGYDKQ